MPPIEFAKRVNTATPRTHGCCDGCSEMVVGTRSELVLQHAGHEVRALICRECVARYVVRGPHGATNEAVQRFRQRVAEYRTLVPLPASRTHVAPLRETAAAQRARLKAATDAAVARAPRRSVTTR